MDLVYLRRLGVVVALVRLLPGRTITVCCAYLVETIDLFHPTVERDVLFFVFIFKGNIVMVQFWV